jgi:glycine/D-amino acid oxidase-like deaminating enzyme
VATFFSYETEEHVKMEPEVYSRPTSVYIGCGGTDTREPLAKYTKDVVAAEEETSSLQRLAKEISTRLADGRVTAQQACYLPLYDVAAPVVAWYRKPEPGVAAIFLASGHVVWGISLAPGTGKTVAEKILGRPRRGEADGDLV